LGYTGSLNLLYRYITQAAPRATSPSPPRSASPRLLLTRPENLRDCPEMTELAALIGEFAQPLTPAEGNDTKLTDRITTVRAADLPPFANGLELDRAAVDAGLTLPYHNGRTEGVNTRTKKIMRQMHGRAGFPLLRHRILRQ
jgi:transposase